MLVFNALNDLEAPTLEAFEQISQRKTSSGQPILARSNRYVEERTAQYERQQMIQEISQGRSTYSARDQYRVLKVYVSADLESEDTATLQKIHAIVLGQRDIVKLPPEQRREVIRQITKDNRPPEAVHIKNPLPARYVCTVPSSYGYQVGQEIALDTPVSFAKLGKQDQKILWLEHGSAALDALLRPGKA
jgi:hypothetical protein